MNQCPECETTQSRLAPFCENCGYRLRNPATAVEGVAAITPEMLAQAKNASRQAQQAEDVSRDTRPEPAAVPKTILGDMAAVPFDQVNVQREDLEPKGVVSSIIADNPVDRSAIMTVQPGVVGEPPKVGADRLILFTSIWVAVTVIGVMFSYYMLKQNEKKVSPIHVRAVASKVEIESGTFLKGLDESTRSFILQVCMKISDEPDDECEQKKLLRGEYPQKSVKVDAFSIDKLEVTNAQYTQCVEAGGCDAIDYKNCKVYTPKGFQISLRVPKVLKSSEHPVVCVTRDQAQAFCKAQSGTLPTHAQWEYAARGGDALLFPWGNTWGPQKANWGEFDMIKSAVSGKIDRFAFTAPVGQYKEGASPFGVLDMGGNASEWVLGDARRGEVRGGSWISDPFALRTTVQKRIVAKTKRTDVGFRCAYVTP